MKEHESLLDKIGRLMPRLVLPEKKRFDPTDFIYEVVEGKLWTDVEMVMYRSLVTMGAMVKVDLNLRGEEDLEVDTLLPGLAQADPKNRTRGLKRTANRPKDERRLRKGKLRKGLRHRRSDS